MTPEGVVKRDVSRLLSGYTPELYFYMPVPSGFGKQGLDYIGCFRGHFFAIETKAPGGKPTPRQYLTMRLMEKAGAKVFVTDGPLEEIEQWLNEIKRG